MNNFGKKIIALCCAAAVAVPAGFIAPASFRAEEIDALMDGLNAEAVVEVQDGLDAEAVITVQDGVSVDASDVTQVTSVTVNPSVVLLFPGDQTTLNALVEPLDADNQSIVWTSSNANVVEIDQAGNLTAKASGKADITLASASNPNAKDICKVTVFSEGDAITFDNSTDTYDASATYTAKKDATGSVAAVFSGHSDKTVDELEIDDIYYEGIRIPVIEIGANAVAKHKKLKSVYIGESVEKIGAGAFQGCKKLKKIEIDTDALTSASVADSAFKKINKKAKFLVDDEDAYAAYKKWLKKKGCKKAKVINNE